MHNGLKNVHQQMLGITEYNKHCIDAFLKFVVLTFADTYCVNVILAVTVNSFLSLVTGLDLHILSILHYTLKQIWSTIFLSH